MAHQPMLRPDPSERPQPADAPPSAQTREPEWIEEGAGLYLAELAATLASHGGGRASADLALDLVLNEIVEQARLATTATGAAVALVRGDEMVCRATTGTNAPDLGVRLNTHSSLSGACVQKKEAQRCDDTETDPRVDAAACGRLGVRSILVAPVLEGEELLGVFEIFSSRPNAFGDHDTQTVQGLSRRIVNSLRHAETVASAPAVMAPAAGAIKAEPQPELPETRFNLQTMQTYKDARPRDYWTILLTGIVIGLALLLGWMVGRVGWQRAIRGRPTQPRLEAPAQKQESPPQTGVASNPQVDAAPVERKPVASGVVPRPAQAPSQAKTEAQGSPAGGLMVYESGQLVFQMTPLQKTRRSASPVPVSSEMATSRLVERVEPQYPQAAREQHIQGPVVLQALVGKDGAVQHLEIISGDSQLAAAAADAVRQWRFKPYRPKGRPVEFETRITVNFTLP